MAKIEKLEIKGYKSIKHLDLEMRNLNVLIGANGAGKSNFISIFEILLRELMLATTNIDNFVQAVISDFGSSLLYFGPKVTNKIELKLHSNNKNYEYNLSWKTGDKLMLDDSSSSADLNINFQTYHFNDTSPKSPIRLTNNINDNERLRYDGANISAYLYLIKEKYPEHYRHILSVVQLAAPYIKDLKLRPNPLNPEYIRLEWVHKKYEDKYFDITDLSDGTLRFLCLATVLTMAKKDETIIIDEPELGLHPCALTVLGGMIKSAAVNSQIIISTQSVELVNQFEPEDIIVVSLKDEASEFKRLDAKELESWLEDYSLGELWKQNVFAVFKDAHGGNP